MSNEVVAIVCAALVLVGLGVFFSMRKLGQDRPFFALFLGFLLVWCALQLGGSALLLRPREPKPIADDTGRKVLKIVVDVGGAACFEARPGENALLTAIEAILEHVERQAMGESRRQRPPFWRWLSDEGGLFVDWRPTPAPDRPTEQPVDCELYLLDGESCWQAGRGRPSVAFRRATSEQTPRTTGLPAGSIMEALKLPAGSETTLLFIVTADLNFVEDEQEWRTFDRGTAGFVSVMLPSVPRSGVARRGAAAKAALLRDRGAQVVWLRERPADARAGDAYVPLFTSEKVESLYDSDVTSWDTPTDLDEERRKRLGSEQVTDVETAIKAGALNGFDRLVPAPTRPDSHVSAGEPALACLVAALLALSLGAFVVVPPRRLVCEASPPGWTSRLAWLLLVVGGGAFGIALAVWRYWPGAEWAQAGRPALALWAFLVAVAVLFVFPTFERLFGDPDRRVRMVPWAALLLVELLLPALAGLLWPGLGGLAIGRWVGLGLLSPFLLTTLLCLLPARARAPLPPDVPQPQERWWARPPFWGPLVLLVGVWGGVAMIGVAPARADDSLPFSAYLAVASLALLLAPGLFRTIKRVR